MRGKRLLKACRRRHRCRRHAFLDASLGFVCSFVQTVPSVRRVPNAVLRPPRSDHRVPTAAFCLPRAVPRHPLSRILPSNLRVSILVLFLNRWRSNGYFGYGLVILFILVILVILEGLG